MKRLGFGMVAAAVALAPTAHADSQSFIDSVRSIGITGSDSALVGWGLRVCVDLGAGYTPAQIARNVWVNTDLNMPADGARFVAVSIVHLCPRFSDTPYNGYKVA